MQKKEKAAMVDAPHIQELSDEETKKLFDIEACFGRDREDCKKTMGIIREEKYKNKILKGIYNTLMPYGGNTYFHGLIANDRPYTTLKILQTIYEWVGKNKKELAKLVPFSHLDGVDDYSIGKLVKKNFLMLAIAKRYEPLKNKSNDSVKTCNDVYNEIGVLTRDKRFDHSYFTTYQEDDTNLIKWLIEKAPDDCIYQKDGEGYNLIDYAFMKMDIEILAELLKRGGENLLNGSRLLKDNKLENFAYEDAVEKVNLRYPYGNLCSLIGETEWYDRKGEIEGFLEKYNEALEKNDFQKVLDDINGIITKSKEKRQKQKDYLLDLEKTRFSKNEYCCVF